MHSHLLETNRGGAWVESAGERGLICDDDCNCVDINTTCICMYLQYQQKTVKQYTGKQKRVQSRMRRDINYILNDDGSQSSSSSSLGNKSSSH